MTVAERNRLIEEYLPLVHHVLGRLTLRRRRLRRFAGHEAAEEHGPEQAGSNPAGKRQAPLGLGRGRQSLGTGIGAGRTDL